MNDQNLALASKLVGDTYINQAADARRTHEKLVTILLSQKRMPEDGWDEQSVTLFLNELSAMDSNNFVENVGAGEREGRVFSSLVRQRNFGLAHGVGRSGDLSAVQPKAAGSSLLYKLTNFMALDAIHIAGITLAKDCFVAPLATGMSLSLCLTTWALLRPLARYVIWPRIDQKTCFKCILAAGLTPLIIEMQLDKDELKTDIEKIKAVIQEKGASNILAVLSTSSCFAPRTPDNIVEIASICKEFDIYHLVNNAYGLQSSKACHMINEGMRTGRVDAFVQSTDKNFLVPVGGAIISSGSSETLTQISQTYPGRASSSPIVDLFITLLQMGHNGYKRLLSERKVIYTYFSEQLNKVASKFNERVLDIHANQISMAMTLDSFSTSIDPTQLGAILFNSCTSGIRVIVPKKKGNISGHLFVGFGSHHTDYPHVYLTVAAAIGMTVADVDLTITRLTKVLKKALKKKTKESAETAAPVQAKPS